MATKSSRTRTSLHKPSPLQPYVDSRASAGWIFCGHLLERTPSILAGVAVLLALYMSTPYVHSAHRVVKLLAAQPSKPVTTATDTSSVSRAITASTP